PISCYHTVDGLCDLPIQPYCPASLFDIDHHARLGTLDSSTGLVCAVDPPGRVPFSVLVIFPHSHWCTCDLHRSACGPSTCCNRHRFILDALVGLPHTAHLVRSDRSPKMNWRHYAVLFLIGLAVPFAVSRFQH